MLEIGNTVVSFDLFERCFCCKLNECKGCCCVEGDAGAPLTTEEISIINDMLPSVRKFLPQKSIEVIDKYGVSYVDRDGDNVTSLVNDRECVFSYVEDGVCYCALEKAYMEGLTDFPKPISCHLYPVRIAEYHDTTAVNVHRWECCRSAEIFGKEIGLPVYQFLKNPLIRRFGKEWYDDLECAAKVYFSEFKSIKDNK